MVIQELNIGASIVVAALEEACGTNRSKISNLYNSLGDLGMPVILSMNCNILLYYFIFIDIDISLC